MSPNRFLSICALLFCVSCLPNTFLRLVCFRCSFLFFYTFLFGFYGNFTNKLTQKTDWCYCLMSN